MYTFLLLPFGILCIYLAHRHGHALLLLWALATVAFPTIRGKLGVVSVYYSDIVTLVLLATVLIKRGRAATQWGISPWYWVLLAGLALGFLSSANRYGAVLEPGFVFIRYTLSLAPLLVAHRVFRVPGNFRAIGWGVAFGAYLMGLVSIVQVVHRPTALLFDRFFYSNYSSSELYAARMADLGMGELFRVHGMYSVSTGFGGAAADVAALCMLVSGAYRRKWPFHLAAASACVGALLTYSRHAALALLLGILVRTGFHGRRAVRTVAAIAVLLAIASTTVVSEEFWSERLHRGGVSQDENLSRRLILGPANFFNRISAEPSVLVYGIGLGSDHVKANRPSNYRDGFVSNGFLLFILYCGVVAFAAVVGLYLAATRQAWHLLGPDRALATAFIVVVATVVASDNYGFLDSSAWFFWALGFAMIQAAYERSAERTLGSLASHKYHVPSQRPVGMVTVGP